MGSIRRSGRSRRAGRERKRARSRSSGAKQMVPPRAVVKFREGIAAKFAVIFSLLVLIATGTVGYMVYRGAEQSLIDASTDRLKHTAEVIEVRLDARGEAISKDLQFLAATPPVQGTVRAHIEGARQDSTYIDPKTYIDDREWLDQLANIFTVYLKNRPSYVQASFGVFARESVRELVRIEKQGERVHRAPDAVLQTDRDAAFFEKAAELSPGDFHLTDVRLSKAEGAAGSATIPVARAVTPVYAPNGKVYGFIAIEVDARSMLDTFESLVDSKYALYLANGEGDFLNPPYAQGGFRDTFPQAAPWLEGTEDNRLVKRLDGEGRTARIAYFDRIEFGKEPSRQHLLVGITAPYDAILARVSRLRTRSLLITLLFGLAGIAFALGFSGYLTYPLRQITQALSRFGRNGDAAGQ